MKQGSKPLVMSEEETIADDAVIGRAFRRSLVAIICVVALGAAAAWWWNRPEAAPPTTVVQYAPARVRAAAPVQLPKVPFQDITIEAGITFRHENGAAGQKYLPETMGGGCALFDFDDDGDSDLLLVNSAKWPWDEPDSAQPSLVLYRNDGTGKFEDVTAESGIDASFYGMGAAIGDYDADGNIDVFVSAVGENHLFRNLGGGKFQEVTQSAGVAGEPTAWSTSCGFVDYDRDGNLDLVVANYLKWSKEIDEDLRCTLDGKLRAYCRPDAFEGAFPYLYHNNGDGTFTDVTAKAGLQVKNRATNVPVAKSLGLAPVDIDRDGWIDFVFANDTVQNFVFHNQKDGTFAEIGVEAGVAFDSGSGLARGAMGIDTAIFRKDTLGILIGNFANEMTALYCAHNGQLLFSDEAVANGLGPPTRSALTFGVCFLDVDLDGRLDVLAANGHLEEDIQKVQASQRYEQPAQLFWNAGPEQATEFVPLTASQCGEDLFRPMVGRGASFADIDADGDLDVLLTASGGSPRLLRNNVQSEHRWLRVRLQGAGQNRDAIGAWVEVKTPEGAQHQQVMPTRSYLSQVELPVTFGLGNASRIEQVKVHWPDGSQQELVDVQPNQLFVVKQQATEAQPSPASK